MNRRKELSPTLLGKLALLNRAVLALFISLILIIALIPHLSHAVQLSQRSVLIGTSLPGEVTTHEFGFNTTTNTSVGSVVFEYCSNSPIYGAVCTAPAGLVANTAGITSQSGITGLSVSVPFSTANRLVLTRAASIIAPTPVVLDLNSITNQSTSTQSVFVRIGIYTSVDGTGVPVDFGAIVYSTAEGVAVGGFVPPYITLCVGVTVDPRCTSSTGSILALGELSTTSANSVTSQFAVATNDVSGYNTYITGGTMTSGNEVIPPLSINSNSIAGVSQFGINLRSNTNPSSGADVSGAGSGFPSAAYNVSNSFRYNDGDLIASSTLPTNYNRYTVTYLVNVSEDQRPGVYASNYTYIAVATF